MRRSLTGANRQFLPSEHARRLEARDHGERRSGGFARRGVAIAPRIVQRLAQSLEDRGETGCGRGSKTCPGLLRLLVIVSIA